MPSSRPAVAKLELLFLGIEDTSKNKLVAAYNPSKINIDRSVPWTPHPSTKKAAPYLEFTGTQARNLTLELFLDTYETGESVHDKYISHLERATLPLEDRKIAEERCPPTCMVVWGSGFPEFVGVIESLSISYTMFFRDGTPCRATVTVKLKERPAGHHARAETVKKRTKAAREASHRHYMAEVQLRRSNAISRQRRSLAPRG